MAVFDSDIININSTIALKYIVASHFKAFDFMFIIQAT
jgi:hypothetical protein